MILDEWSMSKLNLYLMTVPTRKFIHDGVYECDVSYITHTEYYNYIIDLFMT